MIPSPSPLVVFGGSRALPGSAAPLVARVVGAALRRGWSVACGCAAGADQLALSAVLAAGQAPRLSVFCAGSRSGAGFWRCSAPLPLLRSAEQAGSRVSWEAGGSLRIPLKARLLRRSHAGLAGAQVAVFFLAAPGSAGSLRVAAAAAQRGLQVFAFAVGFAGAPAPLAGCAGSWQPARLAAAPCWRWQPVGEQLALF